MAEADPKPAHQTVVESGLIEYSDLSNETIFLEAMKGIPMEFWPLFNSIKRMRKDWKITHQELEALGNSFDMVSDVRFDNVNAVDFEHCIARKYYIMRYMPLKTQLLFKYLNELYDSRKEYYKEWLARRQFRNQELCVVSIGGGPGTELFALDAHFRYLGKKINYFHKMECLVVENIMPAWHDEFGVLNVADESGTGRVILKNVQYQKFDPKSDNVGNWIKRADIVTVNKYFTSLGECEYEKVRDLFSTMKQDIIVINVNSENRRHNTTSDVRSATMELCFRKIRERTTKSVVGELVLPGIPTIPTAELYIQTHYKYI